MKKKLVFSVTVAALAFVAGAQTVAIAHGGIATKEVRPFTADSVRLAYSRKFSPVILTAEWDGSSFKTIVSNAALKDVLAGVPKDAKVEICIRAKSNDWQEPLAQTISAAGVLPSQVTLFVPSPWSVTDFAKAHKDFSFGLSGHCGMFKDEKTVDAYVERCRKMKIGTVIVDLKAAKRGCYSPTMIDKYKNAGVAVRFWDPGIKNEAVVKEMLSVSPAAICTCSPGGFTKKYLK